MRNLGSKSRNERFETKPLIIGKMLGKNPWDGGPLIINPINTPYICCGYLLGVYIYIYVYYIYIYYIYIYYI